jgi:hypothetical protein
LHCPYLRQRERLIEYTASHIQHIQKALMEMNVQLHHVVSDIIGVTCAFRKNGTFVSLNRGQRFR